MLRREKWLEKNSNMSEYRILSQEEFDAAQARIVYEDNHLLIVNKLPGEIVQGDKTGNEPLSELYKAFIAQRDEKPGQVFMGVPHRLDRPVSGIVILAKTSKSLSRLAEMFRKGDVHKVYWALTCGEPKQPAAELQDWLFRNEERNKTYICKGTSSVSDYKIGDGEGCDGKTVKDCYTSDNEALGKAPRKDAKLARLRYKTIGHTKSFCLVAVELLTGRHHQIRCQFAGIGCPIKGDLKYGAPRSNPDGGICLHSHSVNFIHPVKKTEVMVEAPVPDSWPPVDFI